MEKVKLEYVWLDGYTPEPNIRSKTKIEETEDVENFKLSDCPDWSFDGSSTQQAEGDDSDCVLKPVAIYDDSTRLDAYIVLCEVYNSKGKPHPSNTRATFEDRDDLWVAFEQEYFLMDDGKPIGFPKGGYPAPQGKYYCSVGTKNNKGRDLIEEHLNICLDAGIGVTGINAEVAIGQWEFQNFAKGAKKACDDLWVARFLLERTAEEYDLSVELAPKPIQGDWNGSGLHTNFSTKDMRELGKKEVYDKVCEAFSKVHEEHIAVYGSNNDQRLTGLHETQSIDMFSFGVSDRGASIRIPITTVENNWHGYLEDRRPASNADPYKIAGRIIETLKMAE